MEQQAVLALEDGSLFYGQSIGAVGDTTGEVVFNTSMTGYQEILTDPSYAKQIVTLTFPHIGNTGCNAVDEESGQPVAAGLVVRDAAMLHSNWRSKESLRAYLQRNGIVAIAGIDTRRLTRILRSKGALGGCIIAGAKVDKEFREELIVLAELGVDFLMITASSQKRVDFLFNRLPVLAQTRNDFPDSFPGILEQLFPSPEVARRRVYEGSVDHRVLPGMQALMVYHETAIRR